MNDSRRDGAMPRCGMPDRPRSVRRNRPVCSEQGPRRTPTRCLYLPHHARRSRGGASGQQPTGRREDEREPEAICTPSRCSRSEETASQWSARRQLCLSVLGVVPSQQDAAEQAERDAEDPVSDPPAPVRRRAVERLDLLRVDDPVDDYRVDGDAVRSPEHDCGGGVRPATEDGDQESDAHDPEDQRVPHVRDDPTEYREEVEAAVEVVYAEDDAPDALRWRPERLVNTGHRGRVLGDRGNDHLPRGVHQPSGDSGDRTNPQDRWWGNIRSPRVPMDLPEGVGLHRNTSNSVAPAITEESAGSRALKSSRRSRNNTGFATV